MKGGEYWIVSVPNKLEASDPNASAYTWKILSSQLHPIASVYPFDLPILRTGTLEKLFQTADLLVRLDLFCETLVRKLERQFYDLLTPETSHLILEVDEVPVLQYIETWQWKVASYPIHRSLQELTETMTSYSSRLDDELKESVSYLTEKRNRVGKLTRKNQGGLAVIDMKQVFTEDIVIENDLGESDYIIDIAVLVPKSTNKQFISEYEMIGCEIVEFTETEKGSPIIPNSAIKIIEDKEYAIYSMKVLKKFLRQIKVESLAKRFVIKEIDFSVVNTTNHSNEDNESETEVLDNTEELEKAELDLRETVTQIRLWCQSHYGEAVTSWIHVKALRVYVESTLRYGLPVNFGVVLVETSKSSQKVKARKILQEKYKNLDKEGMMDTKTDEIDQVFPYVSFDFNIFGKQ